MRRLTRGSAALLALIGTLVVAAPQAAARSKVRKLKVALFVQQADGVKVQLVDRLNARIRHALRKNKKIKLVHPSRILAAFAGEVPTDAIEEAKKQLKQGFALLEQKRWRNAITAFNSALAAQLRSLAYVKKSKLALAQFGLALAYYHARLRAQTLRMLMKLLGWRPKLRLNADTLPRGFMRLVKKARRKLKKRSRGTFVLRTRPSGAKAYLNGHSVGRTPFSLEGVPTGSHYLTIRKRGYLKLTEEIHLSPKKKKLDLEYALKKSRKYILLEQALNRVWPDFGERRATAAMQEIKTLLLIDQVVLVKPSAPTADGVKVEACLYDLRTGALLKRMSQTLKGPKYKAKEFGAALYQGIRYDGTLPDPGNEKAPDVGKSLPIYKRWWFWVSVGAAVTATIIGIAVPVATRDKGDNIPSGNNPITIRF